jgi:hypothetical protein
MSKLYDTVHDVLAKGPRSTEEIVAECRRPGLNCRPETIELFLELSKDIDRRDGQWASRSRSSHDQIIGALQQAFSGGQTYLPIDRIGRYLDASVSESLTKDDIAAACEATGTFRLRGGFIMRVS